jgi:hypothetical protein
MFLHLPTKGLWIMISNEESQKRRLTMRLLSARRTPKPDDPALGSIEGVEYFLNGKLTREPIMGDD